MGERIEAGDGVIARTLAMRAVMMFVLLAAACGAGALTAERVLLRTSLIDARVLAVRELGELRVLMESAINADVQLIRGFISYVRARPDIDQAEFAQIARDVLKGDGGRIRNIALARDLVISHMFPIEGNEKAIGLDYRQNKDQWPEVERAIRENVIVIAGPLDLVQGGVGIIARFPVRVRTEAAPDSDLWGIASTVIDFDRFLASVRMADYQRDYDLVLTRRDRLAANDEPFWGDPTVLAKDPIQLEVNLINGQWLLSGAPKNGWPEWSEELPLIVALALTVLLLGTWLIIRNWQFDVRTLETNRLLKQANVEAQRAREQAEGANRAKSEFLATMSHEFRTPLNAVIGFAEIIGNQSFGSDATDKYSEYARDIRFSASHLLELVDDLLDISAIEAKTLSLDRRRIEFRPLIKDCVRNFAAKGAAKDLDFSVDIAADVPAEVTVDPRAIKQVLLNLLSNAVKFTPRAGSIKVHARSVPDGVEIGVADTGKGIAPEDLPSVMDSFRTTSGSSYTTGGEAERGWGLGLAICKSLVEAHGGRLSIESTLGKGTEVTVFLRLEEGEA